MAPEQNETVPSAAAVTRPPMTLGRKLLFSLVAVALLFGLLEGLAAVAEPHLFPYKRTMPIPAPNSPGARAFEQEAAAAHQAMKASGALPSQQGIEIPLVADAERKWALPADTKMQIGGVGIRVNGMGMRGPDLKSREAGEVRLLTLGDSSVFGFGLEEVDVFSTVAAGVLAKSWQRKVSGMIGAVPGHDLDQSLQTLDQFGPLVKPTWVVVGNMWSDVYKELPESMVDGYQYLPPVKGFLRGSALYRLLWRGMSPWLNAQQVRWLEGRGDIGSVADGDTRTSLGRYVSLLRKVAKESGRRGARPVYMMLPAPMDFDRLPVPDTVQQFRAAMRQVAEEVNAPLLDGPALFREKDANIGYFIDQVHPNAEGHFLLGVGLGELLAPYGPPPEGQYNYPEVIPDPEVFDRPAHHAPKRIFEGAGPGRRDR